MILRESSLRITLVLILGLAVSEAQNARSYDTSDWIPITKPKQGDQQAPAAEKRATGRVLNLAETPAGKSFFPEDNGRNARQAGSDQQYLKETTQYKAPQQKNVEITQAQLQQYYVTQGPLQSYPQATLLKQNYPNLPVPQQYLLQQQPHQYLLPQTKANNATVYNPLGIGVQTINHELLGGRDNAYKQIDLTSTTPKAEDQNVQLLYVPVEQLQNKQHRSNPGAPPTYNDQRKQQQLVNIEKDFIQQALEAHKLQQQLQAYPSYTLPFYTSTLPPTTLKPVSRKRRPHQPPLAVYMNGNKDAEVFDVLNVLKNAKSIEVQDAVSPNSPEIFVGPATLDPPDGYAKFDLPYLSNLDSNRVERKVDQLPFFVAPLNYKTPPGYSKIPLPSPHVGSVVVSTKHAVEKPEFTVILDDPHQNFDQYNIRTTAAPAPPANVQFAQNLYNSEYQPLGNLDTTTQYYVSRRQPTRSKAKTHQRGRTEPTPQRPEVQDAFAEIHQHRERLEVTPQDAYTAIHQHRGRIEPTPQDAYAGIHQHRGRIEPAPQDAYADLHQHRGRIKATQKPQAQLQDGSTEIQQYRGRIGPNQKPQNAYAEIHHPRGSVDPTQKPEVQLQNAYAEIHHPRGNIDLPQKPEVQLQNAYAEIHDVPQINTSPPPSGNDQVYPGASPTPQIRQKQQTSPHNFYPQQYEEAFSSTPLPKPKNFYAEPQVSSAPVLRPQPEYPADTQPRIEDILSIIPPPPSNPNSQEQQQQQQQQNKHNGFDLGEVYPQFLAAQKPVDDYQKFDQLFQTAFLPNPNLNQVENNTPDQAKATPKPSEATREQTEEGKYTVLEEFSLSQPKTTTPGGTKQKPAEETRSGDYVDETYRGKPHQEEAHSQPLQDYYEQENYQVQLHQGNPVLPGLINELQDQSVRQLLAPALLAPTTTEKAAEKLVQEYQTQNPIGRPDYDYAYQALTTTQAPPVTTEAPQIETTTIKRTRGRGNSRFNLRTSTTSTPRRNAHRARTQQPSRSRYTTTHPPITSQINAERSPTRQRFRTKGRPLLKNGDGNSEITTSPLPQLPQPNPYYELDQAKPQFVAKSKELSPEEEYLIKKYNLAYSVANENQDIPNSKTEVTTYPPPQITPVYIQTTQPTNYHRTTEQNRVRGRFRSKSKAAQYTTTTTPTTTPIPTTTVVLTTTPQVEVKGGSDNEEFYGFIRKPNYRGAEPNYSGVELNYRGAEPNYNEAEQNYREPQASYREPLYSPSYVSSTIQPPANRVPHDDDKPADVVIQNPVPVQFIGEIRPKFHSTTTTTTEAPITTTARYYISTTTTPAPKKRIRGRIRVPSRPRVTSSFSSSAETSTHSSSGEVQTEFEEITTTRRSVAQRTRGRGRAQFRLPEALSKAKTGDEDVEGGNYPRPFTKPTSTEKQLFQIAIDPAYEEDDQIPYASIHRPKIVAPNDIPVEVDKIPTTTAIAGDVDATTLPQAVEEVRKRGYWKLVKQKPVDEFEAAESQNVGVVSANSVDDDKSSKTKPETSTQDFFDSIYQMFGLTAEKVENATVDNLATTNSTTVQSEEEEFTMETTSLLPSTDEAEDVSDASVADVSVKTSTSTEISHETEICYKGVCVKSKDKD